MNQYIDIWHYEKDFVTLVEFYLELKGIKIILGTFAASNVLQLQEFLLMV